MTYKKQPGFTIVELLIVIVVIGILAAITIVAYNGIQQRAQAATAQSDLEGAAKQLAMDQVTTSAYPATVALANSGAGLKASPGTTYQYAVNNTTSPQTYCITATNNTTSYFVSNTNNIPTVGACPGQGAGGVAAVTNLIVNPSFETNLNGLNIAVKNSDTAIVSTTQAYTGGHSLALTAASNTVDSYIEFYLAIQPGVYTVSGYVYLPNNGTTYGNRDALFYNSSGLSSSPGTTGYNRSMISQWQRVSVTFTTTTAGTLGVRFYGPVGTTYIDAVMVTAGSTLYNYVDGNSPNWIWNGTANASTSTGPPL